MWPFPAFAGAALALLVERFAGYPKPLYNAIGHPVQWVGWLIAVLDRMLNRPEASEPEGKARGVLALLLLLLAAFLPSWFIARALSGLSFGWIIEALIATAFIAQHSMRLHVEDVWKALGNSLEDARRSVGLIVGRDPSNLDESGIARAALESLAENTSDGIVAPIFWYALLGLPGVALYKMINTADSMIGHKSERYLHFGWASARLDDLVNLPGSRLSGLLFAAASGNRFKAAVKAMARDAKNHVSPNAGWPESALAEALGIKLGGPRTYGGRLVDLAAMGSGRAELTRDDIRRGLNVYGRAMTWLFVLALALAILL